MKIHPIKKSTKNISQFLEVEWKKADLKHHGRPKTWKSEKYQFKAMEGRKIIGYINLQVEAGVCKIKNLIVAETHQGQGIGKGLMAEAEKIAQSSQAHKITLTTGKGWPAEKFYTKLGYSQIGQIPNHSFKKDHVVYSKEL